MEHFYVIIISCSFQKPHWSGGKGDVELERYLEKGYKCFLVLEVPKEALREEVEVLCDDGYCFGCIRGESRDRRNEKQRHSPETLADMASLGYSCVLTM